MPTPAPSWMSKAERAARALGASTTGHARVRQAVYVVLLENAARRDPWGPYLGQTSRDPDWRFDQHKAGYKASAAVRRFGVRLLPEIVRHLNPLQGWESLELEAALAEAFRTAGVPRVEGGH